MKIKYILFSIFLVTVFSCDTDVYNPNATYPDQYVPIESGDADFSTYVSMGESITAGFSDNSLFAAAQIQNVSCSICRSCSCCIHWFCFGCRSYD